MNSEYLERAIISLKSDCDLSEAQWETLKNCYNARLEPRQTAALLREEESGIDLLYVEISLRMALLSLRMGM